LKKLREEYLAKATPSSWERSRMRKHRHLRSSTREACDIATTLLRSRIEAGDFPRDLWEKLTDVLAEFMAARMAMDAVIDANWD
jgi:hypothetical protein